MQEIIIIKPLYSDPQIILVTIMVDDDLAGGVARSSSTIILKIYDKQVREFYSQEGFQLTMPLKSGGMI